MIAAIAPVVLAYIILGGHALSWPRGELNAVFSLIALALTLFLASSTSRGAPQARSI